METVQYALMPAGAAVLAAGIATAWTPGKRFRSYIQHLAAGVVFAAVVSELFPRLIHARMVTATCIGFAAGVVVLLAIRSVGSTNDALSTSFIAALCADLFIDGWVIGLGYSAGGSHGKLLTLALMVELTSLGFALGSQMRNSGRSRWATIGFTAAVNASLLAGSALEWAVLPKLPHFGSIAVIAFGAAALLYLVTEELLVEAHEEFDSALAAAVFFAGFLLIFLLEIGS